MLCTHTYVLVGEEENIFSMTLFSLKFSIYNPNNFTTKKDD